MRRAGGSVRYGSPSSRVHIDFTGLLYRLGEQNRVIDQESPYRADRVGRAATEQRVMELDFLLSVQAECIRCGLHRHGLALGAAPDFGAESPDAATEATAFSGSICAWYA